MLNLQQFSTLLKISRPRFWLYLAGPALIGIVATSKTWMEVTNLVNVLLFLYFLIPANSWLYGVNDWFDHDTDKLNHKKGAQEHLLDNPHKQLVLQSLLFYVSATIVLFFILPSASSFWLSIFIILSWTYSAPPIRFKARPFLDAISNVLYIIPFFVVVSSDLHESPSMRFLLIGGLWTAGMHIFSAIPDIEPDSAAEIDTTATFLGKRKSLLLVTFLWLIPVTLCLLIFGWVVIPLVTYPLISGYLYFRNSKSLIEKAYWFFPYINGLIGFYLFWIIVFNTIGWEATLKNLGI